MGPFSLLNLKQIVEKRSLIKEPADFIALKEKMKGHLGELILSSLDLDAMLWKLLDIGVSVVSMESEVESEDRAIIDFSCVIILDILLFNVESRGKLLASEMFSELIMKGLFHGNLNIRRVFSHTLYLISR